MRVAVYHQDTNRRSKIIAQAFAGGILRCGDSCIIKSMTAYAGVEADVAVFYGTLVQPMKDYLAAGKHYVYVDLGYWGRLSDGKFNGYHKVSVDSRHPTEYFQKTKHDEKRISAFGKLKMKPWRKSGGHILLAGMSAKACAAEGFKPEQWERNIINLVRRQTDRPIIYRPKPNWPDYTILKGCKFDKNSDLLKSFENCHAVVTHHSNVAVDGIVAGIPAFSWQGVAKPQTLRDINFIERPLMRDDREQWMRDISYCQWNVDEMAAGKPWQHLKDEGLI